MNVEGCSTEEIVCILTTPREETDIFEVDLEQAVLEAQKALSLAQVRVSKLKEKLRLKAELEKRLKELEASRQELNRTFIT